VAAILDAAKWLLPQPPCRIHHRSHAAQAAPDGGQTCLENLLLCSHHHDLIPHAEWSVAIVDG